MRNRQASREWRFLRRFSLLSGVTAAGFTIWSRLVDFTHSEIHKLLSSDRMKRLHDRCIGRQNGFLLISISRREQTQAVVARGDRANLLRPPRESNGGFQCRKYCAHGTSRWAVKRQPCFSSAILGWYADVPQRGPYGISIHQDRLSGGATRESF